MTVATVGQSAAVPQTGVQDGDDHAGAVDPRLMKQVGSQQRRVARVRDVPGVAAPLGNLDGSVFVDTSNVRAAL